MEVGVKFHEGNLCQNPVREGLEKEKVGDGKPGVGVVMGHR